MAIYFLSIRSEYAAMIAAGNKQWEFRKNPAFGSALHPGDLIFIVSIGKDSAQISCMCRVLDILRGNDIQEYFADPNSGHWKEAGCEEGSSRDWNFFSQNILGKFPTAVKLGSFSLESPIDLATVQHVSRQKTWKGIGFTPLNVLNRYRVDSDPADQFFSQVADKILQK